MTAFFHKDMEFSHVPVGTDSDRSDCTVDIIYDFLEYVYIHTYIHSRNYTDHRESVSSINTKEIVMICYCDLCTFDDYNSDCSLIRFTVR